MWLFLRENVPVTISMKRSRRELSIDIVTYRDIIRNDEITLIPSFTFIPKTEVRFYCVLQRFSRIQPSCPPEFKKKRRKKIVSHCKPRL